jgi:hypothetical protein
MNHTMLRQFYTIRDQQVIIYIKFDGKVMERMTHGNRLVISMIIDRSKKYWTRLTEQEPACEVQLVPKKDITKKRKNVHRNVTNSKRNRR